MIRELSEKLKNHSGEFLCEAIGLEETTKTVKFSHVIEPPIKNYEIPEIDNLTEFYSSIGSLTLYFCKDGNEAAFYIAHPSQWDALSDGFIEWIDMLEEDELEEALPKWYSSHKVIGEIPASGNYLLVVTDDTEPGAIYEFEHDGFEFVKLGESIEEFVLKAIDPSPRALAQIASHMRFISEADQQQWWIKELRHNFGKVVINAE